LEVLVTRLVNVVSSHRQTDRQTDVIEHITTPHSLPVTLL